MNLRPLLRLIDSLWLLALIAYLIAGAAAAPFHGDETTYVFASADFDRVLRGEWGALRIETIEGDRVAYERLLNGAVYPYAVGAARYAAGVGSEPLPPRNWVWTLSFDDNLLWGGVALPSVLLPARLAAAAFMAGAIIVLFGLALRFGGRPTAYAASVLFALNPIILLQGRRALPEGALLLFGLLTLWIAAGIARQRELGHRDGLGRWIALILAGALTLCSKQSGALFIAAAFGWIVVPELLRTRRLPGGMIVRAVGASVGILVLAFALSPGLWNNPPARLGELLRERFSLLSMQVSLDPDAPLSLPERALSIIRQPFLTPLQYFESYGFAGSPTYLTMVRAYDDSPFSGLRLDKGGIIGGLMAATLTGLAAVGVVVLFRAKYNGGTTPSAAIGLVVWLTLTVIALLFNPLPWQRYYLPLIPIVALTTGLALAAVARDGLQITTPPPDPQRVKRDHSSPLKPASLPVASPRASQHSVSAARRRGVQLKIPPRFADTAWLIGLCLFVFAGLPLATFHGDETYYTFMGKDFYIAFVEGHPEQLYVNQMWETRETYQRIVNGSIPQHLIGLTMWLGGYQKEELAANGPFYFGTDYDVNMNMGAIPPLVNQWTARIPSNILLCLSVIMMFLIGRMSGGRLLGYVLSFLYVVNPAILLNGRRAMLEGALLGFGLLTIWIGFTIARRRERGQKISVGWWIGLVVAAVAASASKQVGYGYTGIAFATIAVGELLRLRMTRAAVMGFIGVYVRLAVCTVAAIALYYVVSPGLWYNNPIERFQQMIDARGSMMQIHMNFTPNAPASTLHRIDNILTQPFIRPTQHFEDRGFNNSANFMADVRAYEASPLSGVHFGVVGGAVMLVFVLLGLLLNLTRRGRGHDSMILTLGWYGWIFGFIGMMMFNPLPWQRYYLALIPPFVAFAGLALARMIRASQTTDAPQIAPAVPTQRAESAAD